MITHDTHRRAVIWKMNAAQARELADRLDATLHDQDPRHVFNHHVRSLRDAADTVDPHPASHPTPCCPGHAGNQTPDGAPCDHSHAWPRVREQR